MDKLSTAIATTIFNEFHHTVRNYHDIGIDDALATTLSKLTFAEVRTIASRANRFLTIHIDAESLEQLISHAANDRADSELQDRFLYNYATSAMMREFFGMHTTEFCNRRKILGLAGQGQHRPQYCNEETEIAIWTHFQANNDIEIRERYLKVSELTGQPLNIVYPAIKRNEG